MKVTQKRFPCWMSWSWTEKRQYFVIICSYFSFLTWSQLISDLHSLTQTFQRDFQSFWNDLLFSPFCIISTVSPSFLFRMVSVLSICHHFTNSPLQSKNAVSAFQITCKLLFLPWKISEDISRRSVLFHNQRE